jgi:hypothetical protein
MHSVHGSNFLGGVIMTMWVKISLFMFLKFQITHEKQDLLKKKIVCSCFELEFLYFTSEFSGFVCMLLCV